ncbi:MAG TPA: type II secretion system protein [Tepidisphaeraceae bacterium]|nr:type II secretion system protein [Tepidisphaeraceae bacterium]
MRHTKSARKGFSLTELVVVIAIIAVLIGILVPVVSRVRRSAHAADTKNFISQLDAAVQRYSGDFHAYPGPLHYMEIANTGPRTTGTTPSGVFTSFALVSPPPPGYDPTPIETGSITMSENLVLGLLGGLRVTGTVAKPALVYDPLMVGRGPAALNPLQPKNYEPYIDTTHLSWRDTPAGKTGHYADGAGVAQDSKIPEFVDSYPSPMPVLYLRAKVGASTPALRNAWTNSDNPIITDNNLGAPTPRAGQYDVSQYIAYTLGIAPNTIGEEKTINPNDYVGLVFPAHGLNMPNNAVASSMNKGDATYQFPYTAFKYFENPTILDTARQKDQYILISAGPDRVYGTDDDICSFGAVKP